MTETEAGKSRPPKKRRRRIWVLLARIGLPVLCVAAVVAGLVTGYVYLGRRPMHEVFQIETWRHIYDLIFAEN
ncbi:DNA-directed RNA polymerase subunit beta [Paenibacillus xerothermodurans]|uniref:DNA-directed RNA polymerase subunit beta n=1 Tax=Paenibacillus xerothermodurans TaxID=1977292 RepID=A0A2W1N720_PAEXE|nr:DNA-directed RNA polymerase subunit beta [Paenibacillus xerothermodurans]PZE19380.1 DNA-directed RNA polymerase subunit beta [Paenibacillus xerothermodurans]